MPQPQTEPATVTDEPLAGYAEDDFEPPATAPPEPDDEPAGPDDFNPPRGSGAQGG